VAKKSESGSLNGQNLSIGSFESHPKKKDDNLGS
jgi:hypothetical protein